MVANNCSNFREICLQYVKTIIIGGIAFIIDVSVLWLFSMLLGVHYLVGASLGMISGFIISYLGSKYMVFGITDKSIMELVRFLFVFIIGLILSNFFMFFMVEIISLHILLAKIVSAGVVTIWNFILRKFFVFRNTDKKRVMEVR